VDQGKAGQDKRHTPSTPSKGDQPLSPQAKRTKKATKAALSPAQRLKKDARVHSPSGTSPQAKQAKHMDTAPAAGRQESKTLSQLSSDSEPIVPSQLFGPVTTNRVDIRGLGSLSLQLLEAGGFPTFPLGPNDQLAADPLGRPGPLSGCNLRIVNFWNGGGLDIPLALQAWAQEAGATMWNSIHEDAQLGCECGHLAAVVHKLLRGSPRWHDVPLRETVSEPPAESQHGALVIVGSVRCRCWDSGTDL
jgi:hypothetical protein